MSKPVFARSAIFLSALVYPGLGQLVQRRWLAAGVVLIGFTASAAGLFVVAGQIIYLYYSLMDAEAEIVTPSIRPLLWLFALSMLVYAGNVVDVMVANRRARGRSTPDMRGMTRGDGPPPLV